MNRKIVISSLMLGACLAVGVYTLNVARAKYRRPIPITPQRLALPYGQEVTSCVEDIRVVKAEVINAQTPSETIEVQIENVSQLGILAVSLEATNGSESYTTTLRGSFKEDKPIVVIKSHGTGKLSMSLPFGDVPLRIGGVFYEDGTEQGCDSSLKTLHEIKENEKSKKEPPL